MSPLVRINALRRNARAIKGNNAVNQMIRSFHIRSSARYGLNLVSSSSLIRELNLALLGGGVMMFLTYSYFSDRIPSPLRYMREYSTIHNDEGKLIQSSGGYAKGEESFAILTDKEVDNRLRSREMSFFVKRSKGITRYDVAQLPSNNPIEDSHVEKLITFPSPNASSKTLAEREDEEFDNDLYFFGIFDGHSGTFTSAKLSVDLVPYVAHQIANVYQQNNKALGSKSSQGLSFDSALENGFVQLDNDIIYGSLGKLLKEPNNDTMLSALPAISGSCALLAIYNSHDSNLKVAVTGDSRALIGSVNSNGEWTVESLSTDQTGDNEEEVARIRSEHPGEPNVVRNGRVLGSLQPSRAFGDYRYKVKEIEGKRLSDLPDHLKLYFRKEPKDFKTPPYVTAKPVITTTKISPETKFMVLGSDGLFELLSNAEIAGLVIRWMENNNVNDKNIIANGKKGKLPFVKDVSTDTESQRSAFRYRKDGKLEDTSYLMEDNNVATHLIRNALSAGGQKEYVSTLVSIPAPTSRKYRDDLTVTVAFFGEIKKDSVSDDNSIVLNHDATTPPKSKL
ncbi:[Pyruvate dehydrogenase [acetyl-transferring]]-phosphatase 1, mitochondrial [Nakaseomyces bracarensis]|uniref:[Pyruvate dehydrogenase [acetyl-transferring]]-phosphatase 1, mitochondrial n=1 Tax=Nakaseomyces bracarensis TaxID=273131 RepID=A0ABR4NMU5_9SACH